MDETTQILARLAANAALPADQALGNPPGLYRDEGIFALERERIFRRGWLCPGRAADIPNPGDYLTFSLDEQPVFAIRGEDGQVRAFSNVCLHRMMRLLDGQGSCRSRIACPYHAWTYDLEGRLVGAPHMQKSPGFQPRTHRLPTIRTELWQGWIYLTLDPEAPAVADLLAPLDGVVDRYRMADYVPLAMQDHVWKTNWKVLTENFMEGYHLPIAHRKTVGAWFPADETRFPEGVSAAFTWQTFIKDENAKYGRAHPDNTRLTDHWRYTTVMPTIFPTHMVVLAPDHLWYLSLRPKGVGEVHVRFGVAMAPEVMATIRDVDAYRAEIIDFFDRVNEEDRGVVEAIYANTAAPLAQSGRLSWLEREIHDFTGYLARTLAGAPAHARSLRSA